MPRSAAHTHPQPGPGGHSADGDVGELIVRTSHALRRRWMASLEPWDLAPHEARALRVVAAFDGARPSDLAERLRIAPRSATEVIDSLTTKGLAERTPSPTDRRSVLVHLTDAGQQLLTEIQDARARARTDLLAPLTGAERDHLAVLLGKLLDTPEQ